MSTWHTSREPKTLRGLSKRQLFVKILKGMPKPYLWLFSFDVLILVSTLLTTISAWIQAPVLTPEKLEFLLMTSRIQGMSSMALACLLSFYAAYFALRGKLLHDENEAHKVMLSDEIQQSIQRDDPLTRLTPDGAPMEVFIGVFDNEGNRRPGTATVRRKTIQLDGQGNAVDVEVVEEEVQY